MTISFEIPQEIEQQIRTDGKVRSAAHDHKNRGRMWIAGPFLDSDVLWERPGVGTIPSDHGCTRSAGSAAGGPAWNPKARVRSRAGSAT
jgi:hypothetical protein